MDPSTLSLIGEVAKQGVGFIAAGVFFYLFLNERKDNKDLTNKVYDLGLKVVESEIKMTTTVSQSSELIKSTLQLLQGGKT